MLMLGFSKDVGNRPTPCEKYIFRFLMCFFFSGFQIQRITKLPCYIGWKWMDLKWLGLTSKGGTGTGCVRVYRLEVGSICCQMLPEVVVKGHIYIYVYVYICTYYIFIHIHTTIFHTGS